MNANDIRRIYLEFFERKTHKIVPSSPIVNKNDPTLMFANSGMAQFKDYFLGNREAPYKRIADTQKCLRVSGKHNDLEDVGLDGYHHTMFEMLGNWSFGDYFKEEAIEWAWELLTEVYKLPKNQLYVTVFEGDEKDGTQRDDEARAFWLKWVPASQILYGNKKDNFWEMGDQGPCGPCSEIHFDMRPKHERDTLDGATLVNKDNPQVVEIWNLVFMQFERKADGSLIELPAKHVDTGMGFERLVRGIQGKTSNYDTDIFTPFIQHIEHVSGIPYKGSFDSQAKSDIAMRVISDHIRAVSFCIADGQLPSNNGAGYVIRRILRRAIRYYFSFLGIRQPLLYQLVPILAEQMKDIFGELNAQKDFIAKVIMAEEETFLKTLEVGLRRLDAVKVHNNLLDGKVIFELYDTFGFPFDLTRLIAIEKGYELDENGFNQALLVQKERSRAAADKDVSDWTVINDLESAFVGYDTLHTTTQIVKYRTVKTPKGTEYHLVLHETPFYPEGGGQIGDTGTLQIGSQTLQVLDTKKENDLIIHYLSALPTDFESPVAAQVTAAKRRLTENNHSATHLMHAALRQVLGTHVQQKGSLVNDEYLRFDFSHFQKVTPDEIQQIEQIVNEKIRQNITLEEARKIPIAEARNAGAMMLFGEKYGEQVRMITFDSTYSRELCGGCHVPNTSKIGIFKITAEAAVAAGVRRIEAITATHAEQFIQHELEQLQQVRTLFKNPKDLLKAINELHDTNKDLRRHLDKLAALQIRLAKAELLQNAQQRTHARLMVAQVEVETADALKTLAFELGNSSPDAFVVLGANIGGSPALAVYIHEQLVAAHQYHAANIVRDLAKHIQGGGGGQAFFATAGGKNLAGLSQALQQATTLVP